jgi:RNA polymerase-binding transcription factor DksA
MPVGQIDIDQLRQKLEMQRQQVRQFVSRLEHQRESLRIHSEQDGAGRCTASMPLFGRSRQQMTLLSMIEAALRRIADGSFGVCITCSGDIGDRWLDALPWAQSCLQCQVREQIRREVFGPYQTEVLAANAPNVANWQERCEVELCEQHIFYG